MNEQTLDQSLEIREKSAQLLWTGFILLFFVIQAIIWTVAITLTANDKSHAVVSGYEAQGLGWDKQMALRNASVQLGWNAIVTVDPVSDIRQFHEIAIDILDATGNRVPRASVHITAFHRGQAGDPQHIQLSEREPGSYVGAVRIHKSGNWQFDGTAKRDGDTLLISERQSLKASR